MNFQSVLIIASLGILINISNAEKAIDNIEDRLKLLDFKTYTYKVPSIEQRIELFRKRRRTSPINSQRNVFANENDLKGNNNILSIEIDDIDHHNNINKRHACKNLRNRWNQFRLAYDNDKNHKNVKSKESSEESEEFNTEDPFYVASEEDVSKKQEENITKKPKNSNDKRRKNNSQHEHLNKDSESKNVNNEEDDEAENKKRKDSDEETDKEEFLFTNVSPAIAAKENKNRKEITNQHNHRVERDVIEEEYIASTATGFKFTSGYGDFGSKVSFRNINV